MSDEKHYILFSDLHLMNRNLKTSIRVLRCIFEYARVYNAKIIFLGDFFNAKGKSDGKIHLEPIIDMCRLFAEYELVRVIMIPGNHDYITPDKTSLEIFEEFRNVYVVYEPETIDLSDKLQGLMVPFQRDGVKFEEIIKGSKRRDICFAHVGVYGARQYGFLVREEITPELFKGWRYVFSGHYHSPAKIASNIEYLGSILQNTWADACLNKITRRRFVHLRVSGDKFSHSYIETSEPVYLICNSDNIPVDVPEGSKIRINVVNDVNVEEIEKTLLKKSISVDFLYPKKTHEEERRTDLSVKMTPLEIVKTYLQESNDSEFDDEELLEEITRFISEI